MAHRDDCWKLDHLSDAQLLESLSSVLGTQHRTLAALVAHLAEVEERRLHLEAAYSSMFAYCVRQLGMSEDEACRRIDLARLARTFPALFAELESGQITLSVALLLEPVLTPDNHRELLCASRGKSNQQTRELLAAHFPKDDVPSSIRKLPERRPAMASAPDRSSSPAPELSSAPEPEPEPAPEHRSAHATTSLSPNAATKPGRSHIPRAARREVLERDGLGCSWVDAHGVRCGSRAWLELDHRRPQGKGGSSEPDNVRWLCHAHNQLAAEHAYGRTHIERARRLRQRTTPPARERNPATHSDHGQSQRRRGPTLEI